MLAHYTARSLLQGRCAQRLPLAVTHHGLASATLGLRSWRLRRTPTLLTSHALHTLGKTLPTSTCYPLRRSYALFNGVWNRRSREQAYQIEEEAYESPQNVNAQNAYLRELVQLGDYDLLVNYVEGNAQVSLNEESMRYYVDALTQVGQANQIPTKLYQQAAVRPHLTEAIEEYKHTVSQSGAGAGGLSGRMRAPQRGWTMGGSQGGPVRVVIENQTSFLVRSLRVVLGAFLVGTVTLSLISLALESSGLTKMASEGHQIEPVTGKQKATFDDVQGCPEAKEELQEVVDFLRNPDKFTELGGKLPKGVLLTGPPGTGKTLLARAVAGEAGVPFFFMSGSEFDEVYVGVGARRVRDLFAAARKHAPAIVFIDEIDAVGAKRSSREQAYAKQTLNQLLVDLDGFSPTEGVIFIGATNFPELLDKALVRPGRFDRNVHVPLPDVRGRLDILKVHTKNVKLAQEVDLSILARGTPGFSGADLHNMVNQAAIQASRDGSQKVDLHHLEYAKDKILMGAERKSAVMTEEERRNTAYHEGGHALVAFHTRGALPLHKATIIPRGQSLGMVMQLPEMDKVSQSRQELKARMAVAMGGRVAEELIFGYDHVTGGASSDIQQATRVARGMVTALGMSDAVGPIDYTGDESDNILSASTKQLIEEEVKKLVDEATLCARNILESNTEQLHRLAQALLTRETLDAQEIISVMENKPLPPLLTDKRTAAAEDKPTVDPTDSERRSPPPDDDTPNATTTSPTPAPVSVPTTA